MNLQTCFPTHLYHAPLRKGRLERINDELAEECDRLRAFDDAGRRWSARHYPGGYTSYASMNELHRFSSTFEALERQLKRHVRTFVRALEFDLGGRELTMTDCWVNIMPPTAAHSLHLHPLACISGTYYVRTPEGCPGLKFEDPRLDRYMAAPPRKARCRPQNQVHLTVPAAAGHVTLFESWLRHAVAPNPVEAERISISFNYHWT